VEDTKWVLAEEEVGEDNMAFRLPKPTFFKESIKGYQTGSPDINEPKLKIASSNITMKGVEFPVHGKDNHGNEKIMKPGKNYEFPGDYVIETPLKHWGHTPWGDYDHTVWDHAKENIPGAQEVSDMYDESTVVKPLAKKIIKGGKKIKKAYDRAKRQSTPEGESYDTYEPARENYVHPEDWDETFRSNEPGHYNPETNEINYKIAPPPYKDVVWPGKHIKKHENIHNLQEHEGGRGSNMRRLNADVDLAMSNFKKNYKSHKTRNPDPTMDEFRAMSSEELKNWKPTYSYKRWEDLSRSKQKSEYAKALKQFMAKDIYITPGTVEYEAEQRTKNHGPGYYKKKFSKK